MIIRLEKIGKRYTSEWIFRDITQSFSPGNIYGIIGHNGSGKSTLLQIISGFITSSEGRISFADGDVDVTDVYQHLSMSAPYLGLPSEFSVEDSIRNQMQFKSMSKGITLDKILVTTDLEAHRNKTLEKLSSGMRQRLKLALALYSDSNLLILDEPCANLDNHWSDWFNTELHEFTSNRTIIIGSNSNEVELANCNQPFIDVSAH